MIFTICSPLHGPRNRRYGLLGAGSAVEWSNPWSGGWPSHVRFRAYTDQAETMRVPHRFFATTYFAMHSLYD